MSILIDKSTRLIVQGITGRDGLLSCQEDEGIWNQRCRRYFSR